MQKSPISITNEEELRAWLKDKPVEWAQIIAVRSALRVLPFLHTVIQSKVLGRIQKRDLISSGFRANMISWVASKYPTQFMLSAEAANAATSAIDFATSAADAAGYAANATNNSANAATAAAHAAAHAIDSINFTIKNVTSIGTDFTTKTIKNAINAATSAASASTNAAGTIWEALEFDVEQLEQKGNLNNSSIWPDKTINPFKKQTHNLSRFLNNAKNSNWRPWINWYEAVNNNNQVYPWLSLEHEEAVLIEWALIDPKDWDQGPEHVNQLIAEIEQKHFARAKNKVDTKKPSEKPARKKKPELETPPPLSSHVPPMDDSVDPTVDYLDRAEIALALAGRLNEVWDTKNPDGGKRKRWQYYVNAEVWWKKLVGAAENGELKPGYVVHLDAPWGGGKTSFAGFVSRILNPWRTDEKQPDWLTDLEIDDPTTWKEEFRRPWYIVKFNAWQHQHVKPPWWIFYQTIRKQCLTAMRDEKNNRDADEMPTPVENFSYRWLGARWLRWGWCSISEILWRLSTPKFLSLLFFAIATFFTLYICTKYNLLAIDSGKIKVGSFDSSWLSTIVVLLLGGAAPILALITGLTATLLPGTANAANNYSLGAGDPLERFRKHFAKMIKRFRRPVLVIVDDLDRCNPEFVVELVRGMQTILVSPRIVFILLGDRDWIEKSFSEVHKVMKGIDVGKEHEFGARFVEKAIQFSFVLPDIDEKNRRNYVRALLDIKDKESPVTMPTLSPEMAEAIKLHHMQMTDIINIPDFQVREKAADDLFKSEGYKNIPQVQRQQLDLANAKKLTRRAVSDTTVDRGTGHMIEALAPVLPPNPRQIKRIINTLSLLQQTMRLDDPSRSPGSPDWQVLVRWVVLMTEWPKTWYTLTIHPFLVDKVHNSRKYKNIDLPSDDAKALANKIRNEETAMAILNFKDEKNGWAARKITSTEVLWLKQLMPATSGEPLMVEKEQKK